MPETSHPLSPPEEVAADPRVNVLLVDDQPANLLALEAILQGLGLNLAKTHSGEEALRQLLADDYAVVLLDVQMHGLDGFETAKLIRDRERSRHTPIIFLTAYEDNRLPVEQAYALGAVDYLVKPLIPVILRAKVAGFVELFQKTEQVRHQAEQLRQMERREFEHRLAEENARLREKGKALEESEQRFRQLAENINEVFWMADPQGTQILYISPAYEGVWGRSCQSLYEQPRSYLDAVYPEDQDRVAAALEQRSRGEPTDQEFRIVRLDGSVRWVRDRAFPIKDPSGQVYRFAGIAEDITERKQAEEALKEADRRKDEFLAMLAHELRNPLAPIQNAVQIIRLLGSSDPNLQRSRDMIERQVRHMTRLVDDLLEVSRITGGKIKLQTEPMDLVAVTARAVETSRPLIDARHQELTVTFPPQPIELEADPTRVAQVISNLLNNAAKYTENGGHIWLTVGREGSEAVVRVRDSGIGISPDLLPRIFDLFTQADRSLDRSQGGLGIGLTLVRRLVEMHGGNVTVHSPGPGKGSEFIVRLPAQREVRDSKNTAHRQDPAGRQAAAPFPRRVLVVDDNADSAESIAILLQLRGHEVRTALDGRTALEIARQYRPEVILLDIGLPNVDGYEVARQLRREFSQENPLLVAVTGYGQSEDRRKSAQAGFDHHLVKPVNMDDLETVFRSIAPHARAR
jgi:PAS domain S-box-containing protein